MSTNESDSNSSGNSKNDDGQNKSQTFAKEFHITRGAGKNLTEFQREKAKYFFRVNLDLENKEYITWEDVEFYLLFHATTAGKGGSSTDIENRISRTTRMLWEHIHDEVPLPNKLRDQLTLDQALDTWASLSDYIKENNALPPVVQDLVKLGFELYSTDDQTSIQPVAFDQLFQKMELGRPYAIMAFKILTENGTTPLTSDRIESLVQEVITSSDENNPSHFLLPGFFKMIAAKNKSESASSKSDDTNAAAEETPEKKEKESSPVPTPEKASTPQSPKSPAPSPSPSKEEKPPSPTPSAPAAPPTPSASTAPKAPSPKPTTPSPPVSPTFPQVKPTSQPAGPPLASNASTTNALRDEDESIRQLLRFYHIDDGDIVEVAAGSVQRVVLVHPERPIPPYIQQNKELLQKIHPSSLQNQPNLTAGPKLEERGRPAVPPQAQRSSNVPEGERRTKPNAPVREEKRKEVSPEEEEKIISMILKQLTPVVEKRVSEELNRIRSGNTAQDDDDDDDDDDGGFIPFPFMFAGPSPFFAPRSGPPPTSGAANGESSTASSNAGPPPKGQTQDNRLPPGAAFLPPPLLMAMMNDLARSAAAAAASGPSGDRPGFPPGPAGPMGVEGFMLFVDGEPMVPGAAGDVPPRSGPQL